MDDNSVDYIPTGLDKAGETTEDKVVFRKATKMDASKKKDNVANNPKMIFNMTEVTTTRTYIKNHDNYKKETTTRTYIKNHDNYKKEKSISTVSALTFLSAFGLTCLAVGLFCGISFACGILQACKSRSNNNTNQQIELSNI